MKEHCIGYKIIKRLVRRKKKSTKYEELKLYFALCPIKKTISNFCSNKRPLPPAN